MRNGISGVKAVISNLEYAKVSVPDVSSVREFDRPDPRNIRSDIVLVDSGYFQIFQYEWLAGNAATAFSDPFSVILTKSQK